MIATINFEQLECCNCGIIFQVPEEFDENRQEDGQMFYCPNGHEQNYRDTCEEELEKLEARNRELQIEIRQLKCRLLGEIGMKEKIKMWWLGGMERK